MVLSNLVKHLLVRSGCPSVSSVLLKRQIHKSFNQCLNMPVKKAIEEFEVYPDVIKNGLPKDIVNVSFGNLEVNLGNELKPTNVRNIPTKIVYPFSKGKYYTLCMTDPDAPTRTKAIYREWLHWLVVNIPENKIDQGETLAEYIGSGPPPKTGLHRYVFLVYEQTGGLIKPDEKKLTNRSAEGRGKFSIENFAKKYNLGIPVAANFYQAAYDDYVPELYRQLGEA